MAKKTVTYSAVLTSKIPISLEMLERIKAFNANYWYGVHQLLGNAEVGSLIKQFEQYQKKRHVDIGFNIFSLISDYYYRENFHSDILSALLKVEYNKSESSTYFRLFIDWLIKNGSSLKYEDFKNVLIGREEGRVDILIRDQISRKAIIIENKINGAGDMIRQIPRYLEYVESLGLECVTVAYLHLNSKRRPDRREWTAEDSKRVDEKLVSVVAYDETDTDLFNGWIQKCYSLKSNSDINLVLRHYGKLIHKLGANIMNKPIMERFYLEMMKDENYSAARSLKAMLDDLIQFRVERIVEEFGRNTAPFTAIANYQNYVAHFTGIHWKEAHLGLDIIVEVDRYIIQFWDRNDRDGKNLLAKAVVDQMRIAEEYIQNGGLFEKELLFPMQGHLLFGEIVAFKKRLALALDAR